MMMDEDICWMKKQNRHEISRKNIDKHELKMVPTKKRHDALRWTTKKKNRHYPNIRRGLMDVQSEHIEDLTEKVTTYCVAQQRFVEKMVINSHRKKMKRGNTYHQNIGKLLHKNTKYVGSLNETGFCIAACGEWYVILDQGSKFECFLWNCASHQKIQLPRIRIKFKNYFKCILTAPPTETHSEVLFFSRTRPRIIYYGIGRKRWCSLYYHTYLEDPFSQAICCNGKIYATGYFQNILYELPRPRRTIINVISHVAKGGAEDITMCPEKKYLVDSCGEVYLVHRFSVSRFEVYRMDFSRDDWVRTHSLGDRVFFLSSHHSLSFNAEELGIQGNCICFTEDDSKSFYVFNIGDKSLAVSRNHPNSGSLLLQRVRQVPVMRLADNSKHKTLKDVENRVVADATTSEREEMTLFDLLPLGVVGEIGKHLGIGHDYMNFRLVCRNWSLAAPPCRWRHDSKSSIMMPYPWLLSFNRRVKETCSFHDPGRYLTYNKKAPGLSSDCVIRFSKEGWLLCSQGNELFLFELFTLERIQLPDSPRNDISGICFSGLPRSSDFVVVGIAQEDHEISLVMYLCPTTNCWRSFQKAFVPSRSNPVFLNEKFYFLGQDGKLGAFTYIPGQTGKWTVLNRRHKLQLPATACRAFLVSVDQDPLLSVFVGNSGKWVRVYRFSTIMKKWLRLNSLRDCTCFVSETNSLVVKAEENVPTMRNKIYFPCFSSTNGEKMVLYSMEARGFVTDEDSNYVRRNFYDTKEELNCTWFRHRLLSPF